jgi:hypothetical protein
LQHRSRSWDPKSTGSIDHFAVRLRMWWERAMYIQLHVQVRHLHDVYVWQLLGCRRRFDTVPSSATS